LGRGRRPRRRDVGFANSRVVTLGARGRTFPYITEGVVVLASLNFEIQTYEVFLGKKIGVGFPGLNYANGWISCKGAGGEQLLIVFASTQAFADGASNFTNIGGKRGGIVAPMSSFAFYIDILRNESPVYGQIDSVSPESLNLLKTALEPAGDFEKALLAGATA